MSDNNFKNKSGLQMVKIGNFTKGAVEQFEENIVNQTNYLEKVDAGLKSDNKNIKK
jgi:hypothetical protein